MQGQPDSVTRKLGPDAAKLLSLGSFSGSINPWYLLKGTIKIGDIKADGLGTSKGGTIVVEPTSALILARTK